MKKQASSLKASPTRRHPRSAARRDVPHVAMIVETSTGFGRRLLRGVARYVQENGPWSVYLEQRSIYDPAPPWLKGWDGDGIISRAAYPELARLVLQTGIPTVDLNEQVTGLGLPLIFNDHRKIGRLAAEHLLDRGFAQFAFIGHPGIYWSDERREGLVMRLEEAGCTCEEYLGTGRTRRRYHQQSWEKEMDDVAEWVEGLPKPVGVLACNDFRAVQFLDACRRAGVAVPEEVAVIGVDDEEVACELAHPSLSSVVPGALHMGYEAAAMLDVLMHGGTPREQEIHIPPTGVVTRASTDIMAIADPVVASAMEFIRLQACERIGVDDVVRHVGGSRSVLQRRFRKILKRSIRDAIEVIRIDRVKKLLDQTDLTRDEIAWRTGFDHAEYLSAVFKRHTGTTPSGYRRQAKGTGGSDR